MKKLLILFAIIFLSNNLIYGQKKDTLFFKHNDKLLLKKWQDPNSKEFSYGIKGTGNNGLVYFLEQKTYEDLNQKKIKCLKKALTESNVYYRDNKIDDWKLNQYLDKFVIFLVKGKEFIKVEARYEIE